MPSFTFGLKAKPLTIGGISAVRKYAAFRNVACAHPHPPKRFAALRRMGAFRYNAPNHPLPASRIGKNPKGHLVELFGDPVVTKSLT